MVRTGMVVPCFNEAARLDTEAFERFVRANERVRFVLVDDGSTDATRARLEALEKQAPERFEVLALAENRGKAEAVRLGMLRALEFGDYVGYWDADLATPLGEIEALSSILDRDPVVEIVFGARVKLLGRRIERRALRHYVGRVFATIVSEMLDLPIYDTQCGAKLFRATDALRQVIDTPFLSRWVFDVEIIARRQALRGPESPPMHRLLHEYPLQEWRDVAGSKVRPLDGFRAALDLARIYWAYAQPRESRRA